MTKRLVLIILTVALAACAVAQATNIVPTPTEFITTTVPNVIEDIQSFADPDGRSVWNFVVLGSDYREGDPNRQLPHTDAFIVIHVEEIDSRLYVSMISLPRDLWVTADGTPILLNNIYRTFGFDGVSRFVNDQLGLPVDAIAYADMNDFMAFVDDIGGVKLTVDEPIDDYCSIIKDGVAKNKHYVFAYGQTEVFTGQDLLCYARMRKGSDGGFFNRQQRFMSILSAMWFTVETRIEEDVDTVVDAATNHPFVEVWPFVQWPSLARLAIRAKNADGITYVRFASLDNRFVEFGEETGPLADGTIGQFFVHYSLVDLKQWAACAIDANCDFEALSPLQ